MTRATPYLNSSIKPASLTVPFQKAIAWGNEVLANVSISEYNGTAGTLTLYDREGAPTAIPIQANGQMLVRDVEVTQFELLGNGSNFTVAFLPAPSRIDPQYLQQAVPASTNVNITGQSAGLALDTSAQSILSGVNSLNTTLTAIKGLLGAGLPAALSTGGGVKVHDVGS